MNELHFGCAFTVIIVGGYLLLRLACEFLERRSAQPHPGHKRAERREDAWNGEGMRSLAMRQAAVSLAENMASERRTAAVAHGMKEQR
jgi:hypothetical protein